MGLNENGIKLLLYANRKGVCFNNVITIGRQGLHLPHRKLLELLKLFNIKNSNSLAQSTYCENLLRLIGACTVESIDYSDYENASIVHDMNKPIPKELKNSFSLVVDAGTLEHVFNFPVAIKNCMDLLTCGGHFISITPANNFMGHGFYQFSPELFFGLFSLSNGFKIVNLFVVEDNIDAQWYEVSKPKGGISGRVTLSNLQPTYIMFIAVKIQNSVDNDLKTPQQIDCVETYYEKNKKTTNGIATKLNATQAFTYIKNIIKLFPGMRSISTNLRLLLKLRRRFKKRDYAPFDPCKKDA